MSEVWQSRASGQTKGQVSTPATVRAIVSHRGPRYCKYTTSVYRPRSILAVSCIAIASASPTPRHGRIRRGLGGGGPGDVQPHLDHRFAGTLVWLEPAAEVVVEEERRPVRGVDDRPHPVEASAPQIGRDVFDQLVSDPEGGPLHEFRGAVLGEHTDREDLPQRVLAEVALGAPREHEPDGPPQGGEQAGVAKNGERDEPRHVDRVAADGLTVEGDRAVRVCDESGRAAVHLEERGPHEAIAHEGGVAEPPENQLAQTRHGAPVEERQMQASDRGHIRRTRGV